MPEDYLDTQLSTDQRSKRRLSIIGITMGVAMLVVGILGLAYVLVSSAGCPADRRFVEIKPEYQWRRDSDNYCTWTLWDANRQPAPEEAYTNPELPYPGPTPRPLTGFFLWIGGSTALIATGTAGIRSTTCQSSAPDDS